ncbi:unnamed protein product [Mesocestoides corti]|uniref:Uncharacterized protein n=1 Tax=Mesocestoides corti TaxID=53468 RepID=A0A0R3UQF7_MESCO|nr:unnamed protein product [Mesocestoides corti]
MFLLLLLKSCSDFPPNCLARDSNTKLLNGHCQTLLHNLKKEIEEKKKLKIDCEALRFKLLDACHKIELQNAANASDDECRWKDGYGLKDCTYMSRSVYSDHRVKSPCAPASTRSSRPMSEHRCASVDARDHFPAGSFISSGPWLSNTSARRYRSLQHDLGKRRP